MYTGGMATDPKLTRKPSFRQTKTVEMWLKHGRRSKAEALRLAGYSKAVIRHPERVFGSSAVQELMRKSGIVERIEFKPWKKEYDDLPQEMLQVQANVPIFDLSKITPEQVRVLRVRLAELPDMHPPVRMETEETHKPTHEPYQGQVLSEDWRPVYEPRNENLSSM